MKTLIQKTLTSSEEIYNEIQKALQQAKSEIIVATTWFTDQDLLDALINKQKSGVQVRLIISDEKDNKKLSFSKLEKLGGQVVTISKTGFGKMHSKYCIIDKELAILGSYNWTNNARKNNIENAILTNHEPSIQPLIALFEELASNSKKTPKRKRGLFGLFSSKKQPNSAPPVSDPNETEVILTKPSDEDSLEKCRLLLEAIITSEIADFDTEELRALGYKRSEANNGNADVLENTLDTVYSTLMKDIMLNDAHLRLLLTRIASTKSTAITQLESKIETKKQGITRCNEHEKEQLIAQLSRLKSAIDTAKNDLEALNQKSEIEKNKISQLEEEKQKKKLDIVKKPINKSKVVLYSLLTLGVVFYLFMFYSSAIYIMLHSTEDAKAALLQGDYFSVHVFVGDAFSRIIEHGGAMGYWMLGIFFLLPVTFSIVTERFKKKQKFVTLLTGVVVLDFFLALKVSESMHKVEYLAGEVLEQWKISDLIYDSDFWIVFVLGSGGLFVFKYISKYLGEELSVGNKEVIDAQVKFQVAAIDEKIEVIKAGLNKLQEDQKAVNNTIVQLNADVEITEHKKNDLPLQTEKELAYLDQTKERESSAIENLCELHVNQLEGGKLPFSMDNLKERAGIFIEGWNDYLHVYFANAVAEEKARKAQLAKSAWIANKSDQLSIRKVA
jgi:hypothetical protein